MVNQNKIFSFKIKRQANKKKKKKRKKERKKSLSGRCRKDSREWIRTDSNHYKLSRWDGAQHFLQDSKAGTINRIID